MGSYYIPNNKLKGENRILYIFTTKSLIYTAVGALIGFVFYEIFSIIGLKPVGITIILVLSAIAYAIGTLKFPTGNSSIAKNVGGESLDEIIVEYINFQKNKKIYTYSVPRKDATYTVSNSSKMDLFNLNGLNNIMGVENNQEYTKEENKQ